MSDETATIGHVRRKVIAYRDARDWKQFHNPKDLAIGLSLEASEVLEHFRYLNEAEYKQKLAVPAAKRELAHELADCLHALVLLSDALDVDLDDALAEKLALLEHKYPVHLAKGKNLKWTAYTKAKGK